MTNTPSGLLKELYGHDSFRPGQEALITALLEGRDILGILPTGGGKSVCYQIPALLLPGMTLVISPLLSLMQDQVDSLLKKGIPARRLTSEQDTRERRRILMQAAAGQVKLLYLSPERLADPFFRETALRLPISMIAVDEAHCISKWGSEFRPSYRMIADFAEMLPNRPVIAALTATASPDVRNDIMDSLRLRRPYCLTAGFDRPNLFYDVRRVKKKWPVLTELLHRYRGYCGIIYCLTRRSCDRLTKKLVRSGYEAAAYHAGLPREVRSENQRKWIDGEVPLIVATNAFGMGIDKGDVRFVIHYEMPGDPEDYQQEAGRAGRDGLPSDCILLVNDADLKICRAFITRASSPLLRQKMEHDLACMRVMTGGSRCIRASLLSYFGEHTPEFCGKCSVCLRNGPFPKPDPEEDLTALHKNLRNIRQRIARSSGRSTSRIFSNESLWDMAKRRPETLADLMMMEGVSFLSCIKYGADFLEEIRTWNQSH